ESGKLLLALLIPHEIDLVLGDGDVGVHAAAVDADDGLGQEAGGVANVVGNLTREQLVELDLVCSSDNFAVAVVDFKLAGRNLWVILLVLEAHRALHFSRRIDKLAQRIEREHMIVAASVDEIEAAGFVEAALGVAAGEQEAFNLVGCVERVALLLEKLVGVLLENAAQITGVGCSVLIDHGAENQHLAIAEHVGGHPVEGAPVDAETKIALFLRGEAANRRSIERQILIRAEEKLLVVVQQVQAAFQIGKED